MNTYIYNTLVDFPDEGDRKDFWLQSYLYLKNSASYPSRLHRKRTSAHLDEGSEVEEGGDQCHVRLRIVKAPRGAAVLRPDVVPKLLDRLAPIGDCRPLDGRVRAEKAAGEGLRRRLGGPGWAVSWI